MGQMNIDTGHFNINTGQMNIDTGHDSDPRNRTVLTH